jgi:hypothetical protein
MSRGGNWSKIHLPELQGGFVCTESKIVLQGAGPIQRAYRKPSPVAINIKTMYHARVVFRIEKEPVEAYFRACSCAGHVVAVCQVVMEGADRGTTGFICKYLYLLAELLQGFERRMIGQRTWCLFW